MFVSYIDRMIDLRKTHNYTQTQIAKHLQVAQNTYSDYECGKLKPTISILISLARLYNVDMNYMLGVSNHELSFPAF